MNDSQRLDFMFEHGLRCKRMSRGYVYRGQIVNHDVYIVEDEDEKAIAMGNNARQAIDIAAAYRKHEVKLF